MERNNYIYQQPVKMIRSKRGFVEHMIAWKIVMIPTIFFMLFMSIFIITKFHVVSMKNIVLDDMETFGGYTTQIDNRIRNICNIRGLNYNQLVIVATPATQQYGTQLDLSISYSYSTNWLFNFKLFTVKETGAITSEVIIR